jgi:hypothetical protein
MKEHVYYVKERKLIDEMLTVLDEIKLVYGDWLGK